LTRTLRIGLDAHMVGGRETGNETYVRGLVDGFSELDRNFDLTVFHVGEAWRPPGPRLHFERLTGAGPWRRLAADLPRLAARARVDVLHTTYVAPLWAPSRLVITVHDISFATHPEWFSNRDRVMLSTAVPWSIRKAARIITVSETCRAEIVERYRVPEGKVVAIPNAAGAAALPIGEAEAKAELGALGIDPSRPYLLAVGNLQPRKNLPRLLEAFRLIVERGHDLDLVVAGVQRYRGAEVIAGARDLGNRVHFPGYLTDRQLAACYHSAEVFVFPSLFEGFGIPALEAMAHGVPVACSGGGALEDVCGPAAVYFDPLEVESITATLERVLSDRRLREELGRSGRVREREFSWSRSAELTLSVYEAAMSGDRPLTPD
jgi:glycosyltransferase involved in cell wall biosynthesis